MANCILSRSLVSIQIAAATAQGQVVQRRPPAVLPGDKVVHDVPECGGRLRQQAVFAAVACAAANFPLQGLVHDRLRLLDLGGAGRPPLGLL